jgi:hypothetical protein
MAGTLSPVMLMAASGLLDNTALEVNTDLTANISAYENLSAISTFAAVIANATGTVANATLANLQQVGSTDLPAVTNTVPADYVAFVSIGNASVLANTYTMGFSGAVSDRANVIMGDGDLGLFAQIYQTSVTYRDQSNQYIATGQNAGAVNATFVSMYSLSTGGVSDVSTDLPAFGADLARLGYAINLAELNLLGFPSTLLRQTIQRGNGGILPALKSQLELNSITTEALLALVTTPTPEIIGSQELAIYRAMLNIQGDDLAQILDILDVTITGLTNMADLLNPVKIFPNSYLSLTVPPQQTVDTSLASPSIYIQAATVNNQLGQVFGTDGACQIRNKIVPADQALATQVIGRSLQTIQNIAELELPDLAAAVRALETFANLLIIQGSTEAVSDAIVASLTGEVAPTLVSGNISIPMSTGPGNTFVTYDFIGTAAGYPHAVELATVTSDIQAMTQSGDLDNLLDPVSGAYAAMESVLAGNLTVAPPWGSGVYGNINLALDAVIANTNTEIANIAVASAYTANLTEAWAIMSQQLIREEYNQYLAHVELDELTANSLPTVMSLAGQVHDIGLDIAPRDSSDFFEATANVQNQGGQAVIASLREGRNIAALQAVGIGININLSDTLPVD